MMDGGMEVSISWAQIEGIRAKCNMIYNSESINSNTTVY